MVASEICLHDMLPVLVKVWSLNREKFEKNSFFKQ